MGPVIYIQPRRVALALASLVAVLIVADIVTKLIGERHLIALFSLDEEQNIPTWYSSTLLMTAATLLGIIALVTRAAQKRYALRWGFLSLVFVYLSCDDVAILHEKGNALARFLPQYTLLHFPWVLPYAIGLTILAAFFFKFVMNLPPATRLLFIVAGCMFAGLKIVVEVVLGYYLVLYGPDPVGLEILILMKTALGKMLGAVLFIYALMTYMEAHLGVIQLRFAGRTLKAEVT